ncbi:MAG: hypothetical protein M1823_001330 [Watsoniomyces obsoletus]|nr:MAG: hypothetical protein M1823_001330 [Watsoniomyces obsoletus]
MAYISESIVSVKTERVRSDERVKHRDRRKSVKRRDTNPPAGDTYHVYRHSSSRRRDRPRDPSSREARGGRMADGRRPADVGRRRSGSSSSRSRSSDPKEEPGPVVSDRRPERPVSPVIVKRVPMLARTQSIRPRVVEKVTVVESPKLSRTTSVRDSTKMQQRIPLKRSLTTTTTRTRPTTTSARRASMKESKTPVMETKVVERRESAPSTVQDRRRSVGILSSLFAPSYAPRSPEKKVECLTCCSDVPVSKTARLSCGHNMCSACLKRIFVLSVSDPQHMPPRCCTQEHIPLKHVERLFDARFKVQWNRKYQEYTSKNRIYCPARGCGEWIKPSHISVDGSGRKYGKCSRCKTKVCCLCNGRAHARRECPKDEETNQFIEVAQREGYQRCHSCAAWVELVSGCNHMKCRCTAEFCMLCGAKWKTCNCPWFNYEQVESDRLNHMNVGQPAHMNEQERMLAERAQNQPRAFHEEVERRRRQEQEDEILARRMQMLNMDPPAEVGYIARDPGIFSVGHPPDPFLTQQFMPPRDNRRGGDYVPAANTTTTTRGLPTQHRRRESVFDWRRQTFTSHHLERGAVEVLLNQELQTAPPSPPPLYPPLPPQYTPPINRARTVERRGYESRRSRSTLAGLTRGRGQAGGRVAAWLKYIGDGLPDQEMDQEIPVGG